MRKKRDDNYIASRIDYIINRIPGNAFTGSNSSIYPFNKFDILNEQNEITDRYSQDYE